MIEPNSIDRWQAASQQWYKAQEEMKAFLLANYKLVGNKDNEWIFKKPHRPDDLTVTDMDIRKDGTLVLDVELWANGDRYQSYWPFDTNALAAIFYVP